MAKEGLDAAGYCGWISQDINVIHLPVKFSRNLCLQHQLMEYL